jgi:hypothetical protein
VARTKAAKTAEKTIDESLRHLELSDAEKDALQDGIAVRAREARPVKLDHYTKRDDSDVLIGQFCRIEKGDHAGEIGTFTGVETDDSDGYPESIYVQLRATGVSVVVDYADISPVEWSGR